MCPTGGIGNVRSFVSLFGGNNLDIAVLADRAKGDLKKLEELRRSAILKSGRVITYADFAGKEEADVEDLFSAAIFVDIVNRAYNLSGSNVLTPAKLKAADQTTERQVKRVEAAFRVLSADAPEYDHFTPAAWLLSNPSVLVGDGADIVGTLKRAEALFVTVNGMLAAT